MTGRYPEPPAKGESDPRWRIQLLGELSAERDGRVVAHFEGRKAGALLAYLAFYADRRHAREVLAELLWPDEDPEATRARLRQALASLRRVLEPARSGAAREFDAALFVADAASVQLNRGCFSTDVMEFAECLRRAEGAASPEERISFLSRAVDLYRGELLPGHYEEWIAPERARFLDQYLGALRRLADALAETADMEGAIACARRAVAADPLREESHRYLMRLYARTDRWSELRRQYRDLEALLRQELSAAPSPATQQLARELCSGGVEEWRSGRVEEGVGPGVRSSTLPLFHSSTLPLFASSPPAALFRWTLRSMSTAPRTPGSALPSRAETVSSSSRGRGRSERHPCWHAASSRRGKQARGSP